MLRTFSSAAIVTALLVAAASPLVRAGSAGELCALPTASLVAAASQNGGDADALKEVGKHAIATWYTDRESVESYTKKIVDITSYCDPSTRMTLVVYGLPNKDCEAGYSTGGVNKNADDYKKWVQLLADGVGQRKVLYVLEPDAVGLLAKGGCGTTAGYAENVKAALEILSKNPNADIYMDVGYWTLMSESDAKGIATTVKQLVKGGRLKGIALNTSNYRPNKQMSDLCANFQKAYGDNSLNCIVDTSRNYNESPPSSEWCNADFGGVGIPPTTATGFSNLDYFIWIKPPGESDGACDGADHDSHAMKGPGAGQFFKQHFEALWKNGYFAKEKKVPVIDSSAPTAAQISSDQLTPPPVTPTPATPTPAPTTLTPTTQNLDTQTTTATSPSATIAAPAAEVTTPTPDSTTASAIPSTRQYVTVSESPSSEVRERTDSPAPTPASSQKKKHKKKKTQTKCESGLEQLPADAESEHSNASATGPTTQSLSSTETKEADTVATNSTEAAKIAPLSSNLAESASTSTAGAAAADQASTKSSGVSGSGLGDGAIAGIVAAAVVAVAAAAVAFRRRGEARRRANTLQTPVEIFRPVGVQML